MFCTEHDFGFDGVLARLKPQFQILVNQINRLVAIDPEPLAYELDRSKRASFVFKEPSLDDVDFTGLFGDGPYAFVAVRPGLGLVAACPIGPNQSGYIKCKGMADDLMINIKTKRFMKITSGGYLFDKVEWGPASMTIGTCKAF